MSHRRLRPFTLTPSLRLIANSPAFQDTRRRDLRRLLLGLLALAIGLAVVIFYQ